MKILDRHIGFHVVRDSLLALFTLLAVFSLVEFLDDLSNVGKGSYTVVAAIEYMLLTTPNRIFILFPIAGVIGTLIGLGSLAAHRELVVIRAAGVSSLRIAGAAMAHLQEKQSREWPESPANPLAQRDARTAGRTGGG